MKVSVSLLALACAASASPLRVIVVSNNGEPFRPIPAPLPPVGADGKLELAVAHLNVIKPSQQIGGPDRPVHVIDAVPDPNPARKGGILRSSKPMNSKGKNTGYRVEHIWMEPPAGSLIKPAVQPERHVSVNGPPPYLHAPGEFPPPPFPEFDIEHPYHPLPEHFNRMHYSHWRHGSPSFLMRVHFALMSLGPWEGRAVAFVLGCGIGVLLRMFWVLTVLTYRAVRGPSSSAIALSEAEQYVILEGEDGEGAEEIFVAPPMYTYPVEKVALPVEVEVPPIVVSETEAEATTK
ncbi:F-box domain-containing protein [Mycena sanguinolenta]|uniref:F-box domain-containing protein n=1 Tax=Mycena sanguinolenta TaxID=230812 RepID=A0A8H7CG91_9AGAR|nr:F-box domain-containing protein [Mycena sanguinolenta]